MIVNTAIRTVSDLRKVGGKEWGKFIDKIAKTNGSERICDTFQTKSGKTVFHIYKPAKEVGGSAFIERQVHNGEHSICKAHLFEPASNIEKSQIKLSSVTGEHSYRGDVEHWSRWDEGSGDSLKINANGAWEPNYRYALLNLDTDLQNAKSVKGTMWDRNTTKYTKVEEMPVSKDLVAGLVDYIRTGKTTESVKQFITEKLGFELMK